MEQDTYSSNYNGIFQQENTETNCLKKSMGGELNLEIYKINQKRKVQQEL